MVTFCMSRSAGCPINRRASSPSSYNLLRSLFRVEPPASPIVSISYSLPRTHESHLFPLFSITPGQIFGHGGWVGVSLTSKTCSHLLTQLLPATYTHPSHRTRHCVPNTL